MTALPSPETKGSPADMANAFAEMNYTFEAYRQANDERLAQIESRMSADVVTEEKLARIDRVLDDLALKARRPVIGGGAREDAAQREHKSAFALYMRSGETAGLKRLERKALSDGSGPDGGYLAPPNAETDILMRLAQISPIRSIATVRQSSTAVYKRAATTSGAAAGWTGETDAVSQTATQQIAELAYPAMELFAMPAATQAILEDAVVDVEQWIAQEVEMSFAEQEGAAFVSGDGTNKPKGFLSYTTIADASWAWGKIGYVATGVANAFPASNPSDILVDLVYALKAAYRQNATFVMNRRTQSQIRKFKDSQGNYLWAPPAAIGQPATLMNFPLVEAEDMPDYTAGGPAIAFGDFARGYLVVDRMGIRVLRDPYSAKPYVLFYVTKRVGGGVQDFAALKFLSFTAS
jgi:HK97 family phage major capsid protein